MKLSLEEKDDESSILSYHSRMQQWLSAPERVYPVTIDPTATIELTKANLCSGTL